MFRGINSVALPVDIHGFVKTFVRVHFCQRDTNLAIPGKRRSQLRNSLCQTGLQAILWSMS